MLNNMKWFLIKVILLTCNNLILINAEYYSSVHKMSTLMDTELKILDNMEIFIRKNEDKLEFLKEKLAVYEREHEEALAKGSEYLENPLNKYMLIKRLSSQWEGIENVMQYKAGEKTLKKIKKHNIQNSEYEGGIDGLLRLQDVYRLNTSDIAKGILQGVQYDFQFETRHCYDIGQRALATDFFRLAHSWLQEALKRFSEPTETENENDFSFTKLEKLDIELALVNAKYKLGDISGANQTYVDLINLYPASERVAKLYAEFSEESVNKATTEVDYTIDHDPPVKNLASASQSLLYKYTCANILKKTPSEERDLRCSYITETHPFLILAPIKVEEINHFPLLLVFHDIISNNEIALVKNLTTAIQRATVMGTNSSIVSDVRTSQFTFVSVKKHPVLRVIDQRVEDMTNFNMKYSEEHQFANYGIGGHYGEHHDFFYEAFMTPERVSLFEMGNRIATVLIYLSDVEQGGGTAFPYMKSHLLPKKGSAAFWYNLHASGVGDKRTLHGACPIIVGSKWVQNRWIREHDQSDRHPCLLYDDSL
ncbi:prolyl 4-hydroxylase subunit alpha-1-like [Lucilia cuprina]|uniref:prolyl 4-hydroxylase subunit alpha-1-like n=1 Tax=Lucilia cuprina TaxID=7375 RepID=UPI001F050859|nr:prolyl 4-hydroxylase subunit alpha-1-like [Lucilia cuprina]